ncbi:hypothetical protein Q7P37_009520 [Cladosporium fusiforme]
MVVYYQLPALGKVGSHYLAMGVLGTMFGGVFLLSGGSKKVAQQTPAFNASSKGEEDFIQYVEKIAAPIAFFAHSKQEHPKADDSQRQFLKEADGSNAKREGKALSQVLT